jgi:multidrug efflux pump subunit AcrA (membrane-fusion protein)
VVTRVHVREGDAVEKDQVLVELDPLEEGGS